MNRFDVIVVGLGGVGSFALRSLTRHHRGTKVLGLDRFSRGHEFGSSHGGSRLYRHAYFEDSKYVPLIRYSTNEFKELQDTSGVKLVEECGTLIVENKNGPVITACKSSAEQHGIQVEHIPNYALRDQFPQFVYDKEMVGLLESNSGFVRPEKVIVAALNDAERHGATVWENTTVHSVNEVDHDGTGHVKVVVRRENDEKQVLKAGSVVISAGSWTSSIIPYWAPKLRVTRQVQAWIDVSSASNSNIYNSKNMPTWLLAQSNTATPLYGVPVDPESNENWIKVALHGRDVPTSPEDSNSEVSSAELKELQNAASLFVKGSDALQWPKAKSCMYTMTPDENFLVGRPSGYKRTFAAAGLSGHGFKMTPAIGRILADMSTTGSSLLDAEFLSPSRFNV